MEFLHYSINCKYFDVINFNNCFSFFILHFFFLSPNPFIIMAERVEEELELEGMSRDEARCLLMELGIDADGTMADGVLVDPEYDSDESSLVLRMSVPAVRVSFRVFPPVHVLF